jgi:hypothetical protein
MEGSGSEALSRTIISHSELSCPVTPLINLTDALGGLLLSV